MSKRMIAIIAGISVVVIAAVVVLIIVLSGGNSYRLLKMYEFNGTGSVTREGKGEMTPYTNMVLESGDKIALDTGRLVIQADEDKYIHLDEHTEIKLVATGKSDNSKTEIELIKGGISNDIRNKLSAQSSYEINTPNSTMSVRGTVFYAYIYELDGIKYTRVCVFEGTVATRLVYKDGTVDTMEVAVGKGKEIIIYEDGTTTDYLYDEPQDIDYDTLPENVLLDLKNMIDVDGKTLSITSPEITRILEGPYYVTFMYGDKEFGTQTVKKGEKAVVPSLRPAAAGGWDFDFGSAIEHDTKIEWKQ